MGGLMGSKPNTDPNFNQKDRVLWADGGWEVGTCFLSIWGLVSSLLLINCYPEQSLPCLIVTMENAWENVGQNALHRDSFLYGCFSLFLSTWILMQTVRYLALPSPGCAGGKTQTFVPRIGRKELRACREGLLSCGSSSSKREFLVCGQRQLRISPGKCSLQLPELPFRRTTTQPFS